MTRNQVVLALLRQVTPPGIFRTTGRRLVPWTDVNSQPALFVRHTKDHYQRAATGMPAKLTLECEVWLYSKGGLDPQIPPDESLNDLLDIVDQQLAVAPGPKPAQTLGGLVQHAWIEGTVECYPGDISQQAIAIIPVMILVPSINAA